MYQTPESQLILGLIVFSAAFAWWKGGSPERVGAMFNGVICLGVTILQAVIHQSAGTLPILAADGVLAVGFLVLALRYATLWLGAAMLLQGLAFSMHSALLLEVVEPSIAYYATMNIMSLGVILSIIVGTAQAWITRVRHNREAREEV